jgi:hypothetical protein
MYTKEGTIVFDEIGYAMGVIWKLDDGGIRAKTFTTDSGSGSKTNLFTGTNAVKEATDWIASVWVSDED